MDPWPEPPHSLRIQDGELHVWRLRLDATADQGDRLRGFLSPDELDRAARFRFARDRTRFVAARGQLREIIGRYLDIRPQAVKFRYGLQGKPYLDHHRKGFQFNLAHSGDIGLLAIATDHQVGIDIEQIRPAITESEIADRFFSSEEALALRMLPAEQQRLGFFLCWTRKEAFLKAIGEGIGYGLDQFSVTLVPGEPAMLLEVLTDPGAPLRWSLFHIDPGPGYAGAVATDGRHQKLHCWEDRVG